MTKLDELKDNIYRIKSAPTGAPHDIYIVADYQVIDTLIQIAEAAFEMPRAADATVTVNFPGVFIDYQCAYCGEPMPTHPDDEMQHMGDCPYQRIQNGKKELESE